jgi:hypothetical protein
VKKYGSRTFDAFNIGAVEDVGGESSPSKRRRIEVERPSSSECTQKALEEVESLKKEVEIVNGLKEELHNDLKAQVKTSEKTSKDLSEKLDVQRKRSTLNSAGFVLGNDQL